ncbi:hypothetical protein K402DRAFT_457929 [Aulographum hederae CBS 113979]|uniref:Beta/gamma crystallin 'Greek key' domain-containing protein n=1 Tax=Aulographum hederae CBS 113979 TaxID=1176131 RepID=A0A6G1GL22_9PEZI|nr:hypothetical protein K402DRAFT_457929 [Aulographum hederae CBS 113979]
MQMTTVLIAGLASLAAGAPTSDSLEARGMAANTVTYCTNINFKGTCKTVSVDVRSAACNEVSANYVGKISSFKSDPATSCRLMSTANCNWYAYNPPMKYYYVQKEDRVAVGYNGVKDLRNVSFNDVTSSFQCFSNQGQ